MLVKKKNWSHVRKISQIYVFRTNISDKSMILSYLISNKVISKNYIHQTISCKVIVKKHIWY